MVLTERMQALGGHARSSHQRLLAEQRQESKDNETRGREGGDSAQESFDSGAFDSGSFDPGSFDSAANESGALESGATSSAATGSADPSSTPHNFGNGFEQAARAALRAARELSLPPEEIESIIVDRIAAHLSGKIPIETIDEPADDELPDEMAGEGHASAMAALEEIDYDELPRVPAQRPANDSAELAAAQTASETAAATLLQADIGESTAAAETAQGIQGIQGIQEIQGIETVEAVAVTRAGDRPIEEAREDLNEATSVAAAGIEAGRAPTSETLSETAAAAEPSFADTATPPQAGAQPASHGVATAGESDHDFAARSAIIHEWMNWSALNSDDAEDPANAVSYFLRHLEAKKPRLLDFAAEEKAQVVRAWLVAARCLEA